MSHIVKAPWPMSIRPDPEGRLLYWEADSIMKDKELVEAVSNFLELKPPEEGRYQFAGKLAEGLFIWLKDWHHPVVLTVETGYIVWDCFRSSKSRISQLYQFVGTYRCFADIVRRSANEVPVEFLREGKFDQIFYTDIEGQSDE